MSKPKTSEPKTTSSPNAGSGRLSGALAEFQPFVDGSVLSIKAGEESVDIESTDRAIAIDVALTARRDQDSLKRLRAVSAALLGIIGALETMNAVTPLPERVEPDPKRVASGPNPF